MSLLDHLPFLRMPKRAKEGAPTPDLLALADELGRDVMILAHDIGPRNTGGYPDRLQLAASFCEAALAGTGLKPRRQTFHAHGVECVNLEIEVRGTAHPEEIVIVGAHYDSFWDSPAANDNASGVAATLAVARRLARTPCVRTVRFVLFSNEEPPHFRTETMGSMVYARACRERRERIAAMYTFETIGCFTREPNSQRWPDVPFASLLPSVGDFILLTGSAKARDILKIAHAAFTERAGFPTMAAAIPSAIAEVGWSDHWPFDELDYPAFMVTDTALFRYAHYHKPTDTPEKLDYLAMAQITDGMLAATVALASD